ncbi:hypothetical protein [Streptomyces sp. NPDC005209]|uniref:Rv1733c family protein n=1 Tax=Streptomyces sp. NPDC005209 TaxID=3156715 RepID=UPI0033A93FF4
MRGGQCARKRLWRWRTNPLRRHDDVVEAWTVLVVWAVVLLGGAVAGLVTAQATEAAFARQRAERHPVRAVLLADASGSAAASRRAEERSPASARWTAPDGTVRTGEARVDGDLKAGTEVRVRQDDTGGLVPEPAGRRQAAVEAGLAGTGAACALAGAALAAGTVARRRLDRRRLDGWDREWDRIGPRWGHRTG